MALDLKNRIKKVATKVKDAASTVVSRALYQTPLSGRDDREIGITLEDKKRALKAGPVGSTGYELSLTNKYIASHPTEIVDVGEVKTVGVKKSKSLFKKAYQSLVKPESEKGIKINVYKANQPGAYPKSLSQADSLPMSGREKAGFQTKAVMRELENNPQAGFAKIPDKQEIEATSRKARTQLIDRFAPISDFVKNKNLTADQNPYIAARNFAGRFGKVQNRLDELSEILTPAKADLEVAKEYGLLERYQELSKRGITKFPGKLTIEEINGKKVLLEKSLGPKLPEVKAFLVDIQTPF